MLQQRWCLCACFFLLLAGASAVAVGWGLSGVMGRLQANGVEATGRVTRLTTFASSSGKSHTTHYRVFLDVGHSGRTYQLFDDVTEQRWRSLSRGARVTVVFVPDSSGLCHIGDMADIELVDRTAHGTLLGGLAAMALGAAWLACSLPALRDWLSSFGLPVTSRSVFGAGSGA